MKRILIGFIMDGKGGGIDRFLLNMLDTVASEELHLDFLTNVIDSKLKEQLHQKGADIYAIPNLKHPGKQYRTVKKLIEENKYDIVYFHISTAIDCVAAKAAYDCQVPRRLIHSHSSGNDIAHPIKRFLYDSIHRICKRKLYQWGTEFYGCSKAAGYWLFPKKIVDSEQFHIVYNGVDQQKFHYDEKVRAEVRRAMHVNGHLVIGNVAGFQYQKNHEYLIRIFHEIYQKDQSAILFLIGQGEKEERIRQMVHQLGLGNAVQFLGWRKDIPQLLQAMDVFLLPSRFEGLPIAGVEAQSSGIQCVMSDCITMEAKISERCEFLPAKNGQKQWAEYVINHCEYDRSNTKFLDSVAFYTAEYQREQLREILYG